MIELLKGSLALTELALAEVEAALGSPGTASPYNVPTAARVLGLYSVLFQQPHAELHSLAAALGDVGTSLAA